MGVQGLKTFIEDNDDLLIKNYQLHDTRIVIDASNVVYNLCQKTQSSRQDLFGGDMVVFADGIRTFYKQLKLCNIEVVLVLDGAQAPSKGSVSKQKESLRRAKERFKVTRTVSKTGRARFIMPPAATNVFRSVSIDMGIQLHQCMFEADSEVVRLAHELKCPVISDDGDFYLFDLPFGLIAFSSLNYMNVRKSKKLAENHYYISCCMFNQDNFRKHFPNLDKRVLPLLGILAGNDFVTPTRFQRFCEHMPHRVISENCGLRGVKLKEYQNSNQFKLGKILYYLSERSLEEYVNLICNHYPQQNDLKKLIKDNLQMYAVPEEDEFRFELAKLYYNCFRSINRNEKRKKGSELDVEFDEAIDKVVNWLKVAFEHSVLNYRCLDLMHRNTIFIRSNIDDPRLPSANRTNLRGMEIMLRLLGSEKNDNRPCKVYDRIGDSYEEFEIRPIRTLGNLDILNLTIFDLPELSPEFRKNILLAAFHCTQDDFCNLSHYERYVSNNMRARELLMVRLLLRFIEIDSNKGLWPEFKEGTLLCIAYYFLHDRDQSPFASELKTKVMERKYKKIPNVRTRKYSCRLVHQITQIQAAIISYNFLNALLGDVMERIRPENWLNSCLIYNLTIDLRERRLRLDNLTPSCFKRDPIVPKINRNE